MRKGFVERTWFRLAFVWPYRCDDCDTRFWGFQRSYVPVESPFVALLEYCRGLATTLRTRLSHTAARLGKISITRTGASVSDRRASLS
jgi:hypothetical protein